MAGKAALIFVVGFGLILGFISLNLSKASRMSNNVSWSFYETNAAHNLAMAGANIALARVYQDTSWSSTISKTYDPNNIPGSLHIQRDGNIVRSIATYETSGGDQFSDTVEVYLAGARLQSFSMFAWMTNNERGVNWITGDTVWGRVHTNDRLTVVGSPTFTRKVTTVNGFNALPGTAPNTGSYLEGWESGVAKIDFPTDLSALRTAAGDSATGGHYYMGDIWVFLDPGTSSSGDGVAYIRQSSSGPNIDTVHLNDPGFQGVIMSRRLANVQGTLDGRLTVASAQDIFVQDDILYEQDPRSYPGSDDMMGLVAERNVVVADNVANWSDCTIQASIFSRDSSFMAENWGSNTSGYNGGKRGNLNLLGSIVQDSRGAVGTHNNGVIKTGYLKRYRYDDRLSDPNNRPPYYPTFWAQTMPIVSWWESYRLPDFSKYGI